MISIWTRPIILAAGMMVVFTTGCISGMHTFSSAAAPATRYCNIDNGPAPVFEIPPVERNSTPLSTPETISSGSERVSLQE